MSITSDDIKSIVYEQIDEIGRDDIRQALSLGHGQECIDELADNSAVWVGVRGGDDEAQKAMLTTVLHFVLSQAAVPSHRKAEHNGVELDVVIPDLRTLQKSPESAMVIFLSDTADVSGVEEKVARVLDPRTRVAVALVPQAGDIKYDSYSVEDSTFQNIIRDVRQFLNSSKRVNFGMIS